MYAILLQVRKYIYADEFIELRNIPVKIIYIYIYIYIYICIYIYIREAGVKASTEYVVLSVGFTPTESPID